MQAAARGCIGRGILYCDILPYSTVSTVLVDRTTRNETVFVVV